MNTETDRDASVNGLGYDGGTEPDVRPGASVPGLGYDGDDADDAGETEVDDDQAEAPGPPA